MTAITGIRDGQLFGQEWVGNGEAMVVPPVPLHINRHRRMAADALTAFVGQLVMAVLGGIDDWSVGEAGIIPQMTAHTQRVACPGIGPVAVSAVDAALAHATAQERGKLVILILDLAVGIPSACPIQNLQREMVKEGITRLEIAGQLIAPRMAGAATSSVWLRLTSGGAGS